MNYNFKEIPTNDPKKEIYYCIHDKSGMVTVDVSREVKYPIWEYRLYSYTLKEWEQLDKKKLLRL